MGWGYAVGNRLEALSVGQCFMSMSLITSNFWGAITGEWAGAGRRAFALLTRRHGPLGSCRHSDRLRRGFVGPMCDRDAFHIDPDAGNWRSVGNRP